MGRGIPILMYHRFGDAGERPGRFVVPIDRFERQLAWLRRARYRGLRLDDLVAGLAQSRPPPRRSVVITIDDGFDDFHRLAYPVLRRHGFPATVFLVSGLLGGTCTWTDHPDLAGGRLLDRDDVAELAAAGISFGAHTRTHPSLPGLPPAAARDEIEGSRLDLERELGRRVPHFAYPFGRFDARVEQLTAAAGFDAACSVEQGLCDLRARRYALRRIDVRGDFSLARFALGVWSGNPWWPHLPAGDALPRRERVAAEEP